MSIPTIIKGRNCPRLEAIPHYDSPPSDYAGVVWKPKLMGVTYKIDGVEVNEEEYNRVKRKIEAQFDKPVNNTSARIARLKELIPQAEIAWSRDITTRHIPWNESPERGREKAEFFNLLNDLIEDLELMESA